MSSAASTGRTPGCCPRNEGLGVRSLAIGEDIGGLNETAIVPRANSEKLAVWSKGHVRGEVDGNLRELSQRFGITKYCTARLERCEVARVG